MDSRQVFCPVGEEDDSVLVPGQGFFGHFAAGSDQKAWVEGPVLFGYGFGNAGNGVNQYQFALAVEVPGGQDGSRASTNECLGLQAVYLRRTLEYLAGVLFECFPGGLAFVGAASPVVEGDESPLGRVAEFRQELGAVLIGVGIVKIDSAFGIPEDPAFQDRSVGQGT